VQYQQTTGSCRSVDLNEMSATLPLIAVVLDRLPITLNFYYEIGSRLRMITRRSRGSRSITCASDDSADALEL
jgi:hypothetical protein